MAETDIYKIKLGSDTYNLPFLPLSGGTMSGALDLTNSPNSSDGYKMGLTAGNTGGGIHFKKNGNNDWGQAITWSYGDDYSQAGIYVKSSGGYGTKMYLCTTNLFADGSKAALEIDHTGKISALRSNFVGNLTGNCSGSSGSCTGNAATATNVAWTGVTGKPTILTANGSTGKVDINTIKTNGTYYIDGGATTNSPGAYGEMLCMRNVDTNAQIFVPYSGSNMKYRGGNDSSGYYN